MHKQFPPKVDDWPKGDFIPRARVSLAPIEFTKRLGIKFVTDFDNLDYYDGAMLQLPSGLLIRLIRHKNDHTRGTDVCLPRTEVQVGARVQEVLAELKLDRSEVTWLSAGEPEPPVDRAKRVKTASR